jgi:DNA gyrase subunit A
MVRTRASEVSQVGRNAQGVTLMRVADDEKLMAIESLDVIEDDADPEAGPEAAE